MKRYREGSNGDIWGQIYTEWERLAHKPMVVKIKSHVDMPHLRYNRYPMGWLYANEAADAAAEIEADHQGDRQEWIKRDDKVRDWQSKVCLRLSAIEQHIRDKFGSPAISREDIIHSVVSRNTDKCFKVFGKSKRFIEELGQPNGHRLRQFKANSEWVKCLSCSRRAHNDNRKYWSTKPCTGYRAKDISRGAGLYSTLEAKRARTGECERELSHGPMGTASEAPMEHYVSTTPCLTSTNFVQGDQQGEDELFVDLSDDEDMLMAPDYTLMAFSANWMRGLPTFDGGPHRREGDLIAALALIHL